MMSALRTSPLTLIALILATAGCANFETSRAIDDFAQSLAEADTEGLKERSTERFRHQVLRLPEAQDDLRVLNLPDGPVKIVRIDDVSEDTKHATVEVGDNEKTVETLEYHLKRTDSGDWVVDDVFITQEGRGRNGPVTKSVTEQMNLLLSVREFVAAWGEGQREDVLQAATGEFREILEELPPAYLQQLTSRIVKDARGRSTRPEARITDEHALVMLSRGRGKVILQMDFEDERWRVSDVAMESAEGEALPSARESALALQATAGFLNSYAAVDRDQLARLCSERFFKNSLASADLSTVPIPSIGLLASRYELLYHRDTTDQKTDRADVVIPQGNLSYMVSLVRGQTTGLDASTGDYLVDEVTLYESETGQAKRVSSLFTAHAVVELFAQAVSERDRGMLTALSTSDLNQRAWSRVNDVVLSTVPIQEMEPVAPRVVASVFQGPVAEITVTQGTRALTYILRSSGGRMLVDDVLLPVADRSNSLKSNLEVMLPLYSFALGAHSHDMELLRKNSGTGLDRIVWAHTDSVPDIGFPLVEHLTMPLRTIRTLGDQSVVELSDGRRVTRVTLMREGPHYVVQDVSFVYGDGPQDQAQLLKTMRDVLAARNTHAGGAIEAPRGEVVPASAESF